MLRHAAHSLGEHLKILAEWTTQAEQRVSDGHLFQDPQPSFLLCGLALALEPLTNESSISCCWMTSASNLSELFLDHDTTKASHLVQDLDFASKLLESPANTTCPRNISEIQQHFMSHTSTWCQPFGHVDCSFRWRKRGACRSCGYGGALWGSAMPIYTIGLSSIVKPYSAILVDTLKSLTIALKWKMLTAVSLSPCCPCKYLSYQLSSKV